MDDPRKKKAGVDPVPALLMILVRHILGCYEKQEWAEILGVTPSQVTMWERNVREVSRKRLEQAFDLAEIPCALIDPALRFLRALRNVAGEKRDRGDLALEAFLSAEIVPLILSAADSIREDLTWVPEKEEPVEQWGRLKKRTQEERLLLVEVGEEFQTRELAELIATESAARAVEDPREAGEWAELAQRVRELAPA